MMIKNDHTYMLSSNWQDDDDDFTHMVNLTMVDEGECKGGHGHS